MAYLLIGSPETQEIIAFVKMESMEVCHNIVMTLLQNYDMLLACQQGV